jgi:phthalate 4,5-cis-dihydrodiol dehydrogenase
MTSSFVSGTTWSRACGGRRSNPQSQDRLRRLRLGIAGLGVASTLFVPGVELHPFTDIVAAADLRLDALDAFRRLYGGRTYQSVEALCADPNIDVVWVATPNHVHAQHVIVAASHGKHVICTKPMAMSVDECTAMCEAAESTGVQLLCGQTFSMHPAVHAMREIVQSGELGRLISANSWLSTDWLLKPRLPDELDESKGGGVVYRHGPHLIDTVRLLGGGMVRSVRASVGRWMPERPCAGNFSAFVEFADGTPATISYNGYGYFDTSELTWGHGTRMYGDDERLAVRGSIRHGADAAATAKAEIQFGQRKMKARQGSWFGITVASCERGDVRQSPNGIYVYGESGRREIENVADGIMGYLEMDELYAFLTTGAPIVHSGRWGLATLEVCTAMLVSSSERTEIKLSHQIPVPLS